MKIRSWKTIIGLAIIVGIGLCLFGLGGYAILGGGDAYATATAALAATVPTRNAQATASAHETVEAQASLAEQATRMSSTAQAEGDDDGDGLSNSHEAELGTGPNNADTDGDGLGDGQEVNQYGTSPTQQDTDGDGLGDGAEVYEYGTSPINPDTDADGKSDGIEVSESSDPLRLPTATPQVTSTPTPGASAVTTTAEPSVVAIAAARLDVGVTEGGQLTTQVEGEIGEGTMKFAAPKEMEEEDSATARLELALLKEFIAADAVTIFVEDEDEDDPDGEPGATELRAVEQLMLFEEMSAQLSGVNFDIQPDSAVAKRILPGNETVWNWTIRPRSAGQHSLSLEIFIRLQDESGEFYRAWIYDDTFPVAVIASGGEEAAQADDGAALSAAASPPAAKPTEGGSAAPTAIVEPADDSNLLVVVIVGLIVAIVAVGAVTMILWNQGRRASQGDFSVRNSTAAYAELHVSIDTQFSDDELQALCYKLGIEYANLPAKTKTNKVWELIAYCNRSDQVTKLLELCKKERPSTNWDSLN